MPEEARAKLAGEEHPTSKKAGDTTAIVGPLFASQAALVSSGTRVALLDPRDQERAANRLAIIQPLLEYRAAAPGSHIRRRYEALTLKDGRAITTVDLLVQYLSEQHGVGTRILYIWVAKYEREGGDVALAGKRREDRNQSRWAKQHPRLAELAAYVHLEEKRSCTIAHEQVCRLAGELRVGPPSYETVRSFLRERLSPSMRTLALEGREAYDGKFAPYLRRGYIDVAANQIWVSDHMISDVLCQNDVFGDCDLRHIRLQMTNLLDYRSRFLIDTVFSEVGSSRSIVSAMRRGIAKFGLPSGFYCDNGKDYRKACKGARPREIEQAQRDALERVLAGLPPLLDDGKGSGVMRRLGIEVTYCLPYHAQAKHVERFHRTLHERFDKAFFSYTGSAPHLRPDRTQAALAQHKGLRVMSRRGVLAQEDVAAASALPLASEYIRAYEAWVRSYYNVTPQRGIGMDGRSPAEVFVKERNGQTRPMPSREQLAMMLLERESCKVDRCSIRLLKRRFVPATSDTCASVIMHELSTQQIVVAYDPCDLDRVAVLDSEGHLLCELQPEILMRQSADEETRELIAASMQQRRALHRGTRDSLEELTKSVRKTGHQSGEEVLRQIAQLPAAVGDSVVQRPRHGANQAAIAPPSSWDIASQILEELK